MTHDPIAVQISPDDETALWQAARSDPAARERLIEIHLPFTRILAAKIYAARYDNEIEFAEFLQFATVGLIEAVDRFDPTRGISFNAFAGYRIKGAVLSGIDHMTEKREQYASIRDALADRRNAGKATLNQPETDLFQQLAGMAIGLALGFLIEERSPPAFDFANARENSYAGIELRQLQARVRALIESLPQREKMVIKYHYLNQMPFTIVAETMGVSKGRISQLHQQALHLLREKIKTIRACDVAW